jgi:hypothetical protein
MVTVAITGMLATNRAGAGPGKYSAVNDSDHVSQVTVNLTGSGPNGNSVLITPGWPKQATIQSSNSEDFNIPASVSVTLPGGHPQQQDVLDLNIVWKDLKTNIITGSVVSVSMESLKFDPISGQFALVNIFTTVADRLGPTGSVAVPNVLDGSGTDKLYSLVDLSTYLDAPPSFASGDTYNITNGIATGLPGMMFSLTPFTFDPNGGFVGTPFSGSGFVDGRSSLSALSVPEPNTYFLLGSLGLTGSAFLRRRRVR